MRKPVLPAIGVLGVLALVLLISGALVAVQAQPVQPQGPMPTDTSQMVFPGLEGVPPEEMFNHFLGAQINLTDRNGNLMVVNVTPGTVSSISDSNIVITPNGQTINQTFRITSNTVVHAMPSRGSLMAIAPGDQVIVMTQANSMDALMIAKHMMGARMGFGHPMFR